MSLSAEGERVALVVEVVDMVSKGRIVTLCACWKTDRWKKDGMDRVEVAGGMAVECEDKA